MKRLRAATKEEVEKIRATSDLSEGCIVLALDTAQGVGLAVVRTVVEVDPVYFPDTWNTKLKTFFVRDIETFLSAKGVSAYYFNVKSDAEEWISNVQHWGAERTSPTEEYRFKQTL